MTIHIFTILTLLLFTTSNIFAQQLDYKLSPELEAEKQKAEILNGEGNYDACLLQYESIQKNCKAQQMDFLALDLYQDMFGVIALREDLELEDKLNLLNDYYRKENNDYIKALYYDGLAYSYIYYEELDSMYKYYELANEIYAKEKRYKSQATLNIAIAVEFYFLENLKKAKHHIQIAEKIITQHLYPKKENIPSLYHAQTVIYIELGDYEKAIQSNLKSIQILEADQNTYYLDLAYEYNNLATTYSDIQDLDNALNYYQKAVFIIENSTNSSKIESASFIYNIGATYLQQKKHHQSKEAFLKSLAYLKTENQMDKDMKKDYINNCHQLSECYLYFNQLDSALYYIKQAELLNKNFPYRLSTTYSYFSAIYCKQKAFEKALNYGKKALDVGLEKYGVKSRYTFTSYRTLANTSRLQSKYKMALQYWQKALETISINFSDEQGYSNPKLSDVHFKLQLHEILKFKMSDLKQLYLQDHPDISAEDLFATAKLATENIEQMNKTMKSEVSQSDWLNQEAIPIFETAIQIALDIYAKSNDKSYLNEAFMLSERSKSMLMTYALQEDNASSFGGIHDSLITKEKALQKRLSDAEKKRFDASIAGDIESYQLQDSLIFHYKHDISALIYHFEANYPEYHKLKYANNATNIESIQAILDSETTLIEYFTGKSKIYAFTITKDHAQALTINKGIHYAANILNFHANISDIQAANSNPERSYNSFITAAHYFYNQLLKDCLKQPSQRLIIIPDGQLGYIPFEVLLTEKRDTISNLGDGSPNFAALPYLIKSHKISYNYSGSLLLGQRQNQQKIINGKILALAPDYTHKTCPKWRGQYEKDLRIDLIELPGAYNEVKSLSWAFDGCFLTGTTANEQRFKDEAPNYGILHLAMHGLVDNHQPKLSGLAMEEDMNKQQDNILYAYEIKQLELQAGLVVLSACETGMGKYQRGEGVLSIGRGFMYAGVPSLLMTLWSLNDYSSSRIIEQFYSNLSNGMDKDEAIRQAKLHYLEEHTGPATHPALWACFIQVGDYNAIKINKRSLFPYYIAGAVLFLLLAILLYRFFKKNKEA